MYSEINVTTLNFLVFSIDIKKKINLIQNEFKFREI